MESLNNSTTTLSENPSKTLDHSNPWINTTSKYVYQKHHIPAKNQPFLQDKVVKSNKDASKTRSNNDMNASKTTQASTASIPATTHATIALNYSNKNLKAVAQSVLDYKNSLLILDLSCNTLTDFPNEILELVKLKSLKLDSNKLKKIPSEISELRQLENLSLASNYITALPNTIRQFSKTLSALNISNNRIDSFPEGFTDLVNLKILLIQKNWFISFPTGFSSFTGLKEFSLEWFKYACPPLPVEQNDPKCDNIQKLFNLCIELQSTGKLEVRFEDFLEHFSSSDQDHFAVKDSAGRNLLHLAALEEDIGIVRALAKNRPQLRDEIDQHSQSPLSLAVREERNLAAKVLLMNGVNPNIGSGPVGSPLNVATATYRCGLVKDLLKYGANPNAIDVEGNTPLHLICSIFAKSPKIAQEIGNLLVGAGADPNLLNYDSWSPLHLAIRRGQTECLKWIIETNKKEESHVSKPFDLNIKGGSDQWTPLHLAAGLGHFEVLNLLVDNDADISATTKTGRTPRDVAVNNVIICKVLKKIEDEWIHNQLFNQPTLESKLKEFSASTSVLHLKHMIHSTSNEMLAREKIKINGKLQASRDSKSTGMMPGAGMLRTKHKSDNNRRESGLMRKKTTLRLEDCDRDVSHGESTMLDNIDEVVETREITRMVPRSPNNIQKIQIAQNYRDHVLRNSFSRENGSQILHTVNTCVNTYMNTVNQYTLTCADYQSPNKKDKSRLLTNLSPQATRKTKMAPQSFIFPNEFNNFMKNFESYLDEIKTYQNLLIQETGVPLAEKLKHLFYLQVLHMKINGTLGKISSETIPVELFILCEHIEDELKKGKDQFKKNGIVHNYDIIPRTLLFIFENMDSKKSQKNTLLKIRISKLFGLFKYESAKHFLQQVVQNDKETRPLRTAANDALNLVSTNNPLSANSLLCNDLKYRDRGIVNHLVSPKHDVLNKTGKNNIFPTSSSLSISSKPNKRTFSCMGPVPVKCENIEDDEERQGQGTRKQHDMPNNAPLRSRPDLLKAGAGFTGFRGVQDPLPSKFQSFSCKHSDFNLQISTEDTNKSDVMRSLEVKRTPKRAGVENYFSQV